MTKHCCIHPLFCTARQHPCEEKTNTTSLPSTYRCKLKCSKGRSKLCFLIIQCVINNFVYGLHLCIYKPGSNCRLSLPEWADRHKHSLSLKFFFFFFYNTYTHSLRHTCLHSRDSNRDTNRDAQTHTDVNTEGVTGLMW